jgi:hypothetical protein
VSVRSGAATLKLALAVLAAPPALALLVLALSIVLVKLPGCVASTFTTIVQLALGAIVPALKVRLVPNAAAVAVPAQLLLTSGVPAILRKPAG